MSRFKPMNRLSQALLQVFCFLALFLLSPSVLAQPKKTNDTGPTAIDFSVVGFGGGAAALPSVPAVLLVRATGGDDTRLLQAAIDYIGSQPVQKDGFRGALQLTAGRFNISGQLVLGKSGIVLRGQGEKTVLVATGISRRTLIAIGTVDSVPVKEPVDITDRFVAEGATRVTVERLNGLKVGDRVVLTRPCTANWIADLGMNKDEGMFSENRGMRWPVGSRVLRWDRTIVAVDAAKKQLVLDAPITTAIEKLYGGGTVRKLEIGKMVSNIGLESMVIESSFQTNNKADEEHAWIGVQVNCSEDIWIRDVVARHFVSSAVRVGPRARRVTVLNCRSEEPVSEVGGYRRLSFLVEGQQVLVENCVSDSGLNDFAAGFCAAGPNVFFNCRATHALGASGSFESWASGVLYENVSIEGAALRLTHDLEHAQGAGWTAANSILWNCTATQLEALGPQEYPNRVKTGGGPLFRSGNASHAAAKAATTVTATPREFTEKEIGNVATSPVQKRPALRIVNGRFVLGEKTLWGGTVGDNFWRGQAFPAGELNSGICLTRWVPGRTGPGLTEDLPALAARMAAQGNLFYQSVTGLWYDRRRDDHSILARSNGWVWAPFLEMPWRRTGQGKAWDGLSLYDLATFNPWYFGRLKEFAGLCDDNGLVLYYNLYDTHNFLEYLTHWVDYPFRPANNVNNTGLAEPPPVEGWARFHGANEFYNVRNPQLAQLHRAYILHVLDELGPYTNVIFSAASEFSGPLVFQRFFLQTVKEWGTQNKRRVLVSLNSSKDITDSILADPELSALVDVIDTRYWQYRPAGTFSVGNDLWAPPGGGNRSFREMVGEAFILQSGIPFSTQQEQMYRQVREYTDRFPDKAIVSVYNDVSPLASLMAGGAQVIGGGQRSGSPGHTAIGSFVQDHLGDVLMNMKPADNLVEERNTNWCLADRKQQALLVYSTGGDSIRFSANTPTGNYEGTWYDPLSEKLLPAITIYRLEKGRSIPKPSRLGLVLLLRRKSD